MRPRRLTTAIALAACCSALAPSSALAHAVLEGTSPARGAVVKKQPSAVVFRFDEPVTGTLGAVEVFGPSGNRVDEGTAFHPGGAGPEIGVHLKPGLAKGTYTATYRVISADGHIVSSGFLFSIGKQGGAPKESLAQLLSGQGQTGPVTSTAFGTVRAIQYASIALAGGLVAFLLVVWIPALAGTAGGEDRWRRASLAFARRASWLGIFVAAAGIVSAAAGIILEGAESVGQPFGGAIDWTVISDVLGTRFGTVWGLAVIAWLVIGIDLVVATRGQAGARVGLRAARLGATGLAPPDRRAAALWLAPSVAAIGFLILLPALGGHASTQSPVALMFTTNVVHVAAMTFWVGGLAALLFLAPASTRELEPPERTRLLAATLVRFSPVALAAVATILVSGLIQAYVYVRHLDDLTTTGYGRAVLIKLALLICLIGLGAYNRYRSVPRLRAMASQGRPPGDAGFRLRRALRVEVALLAVVIGVTGALSTYAPPISAYSGPYSTQTTLGPTQFEMTVDPAQTGSNTIHIYMFDPTTGAQYTAAKQVEVAASLPGSQITSLPLRATLSGPGHYTVNGAFLNQAGTWDIGVTIRTSAFDEYTKQFEVPIR